MWAWPVSSAIPPVNSPDYRRIVQAATVIQSSTQACLVWTVLGATRQIIGLQATTVRTRALLMKVGAESTMGAGRAGIAIRKTCKLPHAQNVMMRIRKARVGDTIELLEHTKPASKGCGLFVVVSQSLIHGWRDGLHLYGFCIVVIFHVHDRRHKKTYNPHGQSDNTGNPVPAADANEVRDGAGDH